MLPGSNVELSILKEYTFERKYGIDYVKLLSDNFLMEMFNTTDVNISSMFKYNNLVSRAYKILEVVDTWLLEQISDVHFLDIMYKDEDEKNFYFEVKYDTNRNLQ